MDKEKITELAKQVGIDTELFNGWDGCALALYPIRGGRGENFEVAQRQAIQNMESKSWALDLGHRAVRLTSEQGEALKRKLEAEGIKLEEGSLSDAYMARAHRASEEHDDVLSELAKR